jgi:hypothetical protein
MMKYNAEYTGRLCVIIRTALANAIRLKIVANAADPLIAAIQLASAK